MEEKKKSDKIILVLFPPIINNFNFCSDAEEYFIESQSIKKNLSLEKEFEKLEKGELLNLIDADYSKEISGIIKQRVEPKLVLINYPRTERQWNSLSQELAQEKKKINSIVLLNLVEYELIASIKNEYLVCPLCEKISNKAEVVKDNEKFVCPNDKNYHFSFAEISKFNEQIISYYLKNSAELVKKFLQANNSSASNIIQLNISKKEDIFSGAVQKNLLKIIKDI